MKKDLKNQPVSIPETDAVAAVEATVKKNRKRTPVKWIWEVQTSGERERRKEERTIRKRKPFGPKLVNRPKKCMLRKKKAQTCPLASSVCQPSGDL